LRPQAALRGSRGRAAADHGPNALARHTAGAGPRGADPPACPGSAVSLPGPGSPAGSCIA